MESIINFDDVSYSVGRNIILDNLSFEIKKGDFVSVIGANGSGKSTLVNILAGFIDYNGYVDVDGFYLNKDNISDIRRRVGIIFDDLNNVNVCESVSDEICVGLNNLGAPEFKISKMVVDIAKEFNIYDILNCNFSNISNSDKVKVFLASTIICNPDVLVIDDCLHQLSVEDRKLVFELLSKYNKVNKLTIIMVTHDMNDVVFSNRVIVLDKGKVRFDGTPNRIFKNRSKLYECGISLPFVVDLSLRLMDKGIVSHVYYDIRKLVDDIWK